MSKYLVHVRNNHSRRIGLVRVTVEVLEPGEETRLPAIGPLDPPEQATPKELAPFASGATRCFQSFLDKYANVNHASEALYRDFTPILVERIK